MEGSHEPHGVLKGPSEQKRVVGDLACQHDTYLQQLSTTVCACTANPVKKASKEEAFEIQLLDTILFPEGGGQPWDHGTLTREEDAMVLPVRKVVRRKLEAIHYAATPLTIGTQVTVKLDWPRRFDQAQQHSGQHLLSAVLDKHAIPTLAWSMGTQLVYIEVPQVPDDLRAIEQECNAYIADNLPITVTETRERPANLPEDYDASAGVIRVVSIGGIDANPCCGTHVRSTAELNSLSILYTTPVKGANRNNHRIFFVVGGRCQSMMSELYGDARATASGLSCQVAQVPEKVDALRTQIKTLMKREKALRQELVAHDTRAMLAALAQPRAMAFLHKPNGDLEYLNAVLANLPDPLPGTCILVACETLVIVGGEAKRVAALSGRVKEAMPALRGGGRANKFQGKMEREIVGRDLQFLSSLSLAADI